MVWGGISHGLKSPLIVIAGNLTGVRCRDEIPYPSQERKRQRSVPHDVGIHRYTTSTVRTKRSEPRLICEKDRLQCLIGNFVWDHVPATASPNFSTGLRWPHVARVCQDFPANHNINPLDWPSYSSDLSPIEHLWDEMDRRVRGRRNAPATLY
jgi:hypothetical protein